MISTKKKLVYNERNTNNVISNPIKPTQPKLYNPKRINLKQKKTVKYKHSNINCSFPCYGPYKTVSYENKLFQAEITLACSNIIIPVIIWINYIIWFYA